MQNPNPQKEWVARKAGFPNTLNPKRRCCETPNRRGLPETCKGVYGAKTKAIEGSGSLETESPSKFDVVGDWAAPCSA